MFAELRNRTSDARGQLHPRGDRRQHGHSAQQHVSTTRAHGPEAVQHDRLSHGMARFGMVEGMLSRIATLRKLSLYKDKNEAK